MYFHFLGVTYGNCDDIPQEKMDHDIFPFDLYVFVDLVDAGNHY